jgi:hypothetical protein
MANRLLRGIAVTVGAGLAVGIGRKLTSRPAYRPAANLNPILTRLEDIESRVARVEITPAAVSLPGPEEIQALGTLVSYQSEDIAILRQDILRIERRNAEQVEAFGQKIALLERQVPASIEATVNARMTELEHKLRGEFNAIHHKTVDTFAETIEKRVIDRINALEANLVDQSHSIVSLREKSLRTDDKLERLLEAVEKLCARTEPKPAPPPTPDPPPPAPPIPTPEPEPEMAYAAPSSPAISPPPIRSSSFKPFGMAIIGLAVLGLRLMR